MDQKPPDLDMEGNPTGDKPPDLDINGNPITGEIPSPNLDLFKGQDFANALARETKPNTIKLFGGEIKRPLGISARPESIKWPLGFRSPSISARKGPPVDNPITPSYGSDEYYGQQLAKSLEKLHEAPPIVPGGGKFLGNIVDPYLPGFGQNVTSRLAGIGARATGELVSGLTTPENLLIAAGFEGAGLAAKMAPGAKEALAKAPLIRPLLKAGEKVNLLEVPQLAKVARTYTQGQIIRGANKALQAGAGLYFGGKSAEQAIKAETPEERVAGVLGTALGGLGVAHSLRGLRSKTPKGFNPKTATRDDFIQEAIRRTNNLPEADKIPLPEGWTERVGTVPGGKEAMIDPLKNEIVYASEEMKNNSSVKNHEYAHILYNSLPETARNNLMESYINQKQSSPLWQKNGKDYMVMNGFHKEDLGIDLGNYFTHPELVEPKVEKLFEMWFPKGKGKGIPGGEASKVETPNKSGQEFSHGLIPRQKRVGYDIGIITPQGEVKTFQTPTETTDANFEHKEVFGEVANITHPSRKFVRHGNIILWDDKPTTEDLISVDNHYGGINHKYQGGVGQGYLPIEIPGPEFAHGLIPRKTETVIVRGPNVKTIDANVQALEAKGYKAVDIDAKGGIIMQRIAKEPKGKTPKTPPVTPLAPKTGTPESRMQAALDAANEAAQIQAEMNVEGHSRQAARARAVKATGLSGMYQRMAAFRGKFDKAGIEPIKLDQADANYFADKIVNATSDQFEIMHASSGLAKLIRGGEQLVPSEIKALERYAGIKIPEYYHGEVGPDGLPKVDIKRPSVFSELVNLPRTLQASLDLSAPFRQGIGLIHNKAWWTSWYTMIRSMGSENFYRNAIDEIQSRMEFLKMRDATGHVQKSLAQRAGLRLTDLTDITKREESMMSTWAEKVPGVRASNRAYTAFLDKLRADAFRDLLKQARKQGYDPYHNDVLLKKIGDYINNATGRGSLPKGLEDSAVALNGLFFSPRLIASRVQMLNPKHYTFENAFVRRQYLKSALSIATAWMTFAGLAKMAGAQVNTDPTNADFMKIRIGNTRLDMGGGFQQYLVLAARMYSGKYTSSITGKTSEMGQKFGQETRKDALLNFIQNKLAPVPSTTMNFLGASRNQPFQVGDTAAKLFTPMFIQDLVSIAREDPELFWMAGLSGVGGGSQTYDRGTDYTFVPPKNDILVPSNARIR